MEEIFSQFLLTHRTLLHLGAAFLLGALIGIERGWEAREQKTGERIAGTRTFALVGLLGGITAILQEQLSALMLPVMLLGVILLALVSYRVRLRHIRNFSITNAVGLILTFCFGVIAVAIDLTMAAAATVITAIVLDNKAGIHRAVTELKAHELDAALKLLLISVVMLPLLPNVAMGPGGVLNPYEMWWLVVLITSVSFVGYFAVRFAGTEKGILFTSLFAGLASSTALTLHFARQCRGTPALTPHFAAGILIACGTMFPRILIYCGLINRELLSLLIAPVVTMAALLYLPALVIWLRHRDKLHLAQPSLTKNPLDLKTAVMFGALLTLILVMGELMRGWFGDSGVLVLASVSGIVDVDAITLSLSRLSQDGLPLMVAVTGIILATATNNCMKSGIALFVGGRSLGLRVVIPMLISTAGGLMMAWLQQIY